MIQNVVGRWLAAALAAATLGGCAEMSQTEKGAAIGALAGSAAGAIIGNQVKGNRPQHAAMGALIGGLGGAAAGGLIGHEMERRQPPAPAMAPPGPPAPAAALPPAPAPVTVAGGYQGDPTRGTIVNATRWRVSLYVDIDPASTGAPTVTLQPQEVRPINLDIGPHRIIAQGFVDTQFGTRPVGRFDRVISVDARAAGWDLRLGEPDFR